MADYATFETGILTPVMTFVGAATNGTKRYRRANYDLLNWDAGSGVPSTYVVPLGTERINGAETVLKDSAQVGHEFGYYGGDIYVIDPSSGDGSDSVIGCHTFGFV